MEERVAKKLRSGDQRLHMCLSILIVKVKRKKKEAAAMPASHRFYVDTTRKMKVLQGACRLKYVAAVVMHNWHVCCYGSQVGAYFEVDPPDLAQYFSVQPST